MTESQEWRKMLKKYYLCHDCKQQDAFTLAGRYPYIKEQKYGRKQ